LTRAHKAHRLWGAAVLSLALSGCASRILKLENQLLSQQNVELSQQLMVCQETTGPADYVQSVDLETIQLFLARAGFPEPVPGPGGNLRVPVKGEHTSFELNIQLFEREKVLFMATSNYLQLEAAQSSPAMVMLLSQIAAINYELLLGKLQLNTSTGDIALSMELNVDDGLGYRTFHNVAHHLVQVADDRYEELLRAAQGTGLQ
jgi:hypothetical protein